MERADASVIDSNFSLGKFKRLCLEYQHASRVFLPHSLSHSNSGEPSAEEIEKIFEQTVKSFKEFYNCEISFEKDIGKDDKPKSRKHKSQYRLSEKPDDGRRSRENLHRIHDAAQTNFLSAAQSKGGHVQLTNLSMGVARDDSATSGQVASCEAPSSISNLCCACVQRRAKQDRQVKSSEPTDRSSTASLPRDLEHSAVNLQAQTPDDAIDRTSDALGTVGRNSNSNTGTSTDTKVFGAPESQTNHTYNTVSDKTHAEYERVDDSENIRDGRDGRNVSEPVITASGSNNCGMRESSMGKTDSISSGSGNNGERNKRKRKTGPRKRTRCYNEDSLTARVKSLLLWSPQETGWALQQVKSLISLFLSESGRQDLTRMVQSFEQAERELMEREWLRAEREKDAARAVQAWQEGEFNGGWLCTGEGRMRARRTKGLELPPLPGREEAETHHWTTSSSLKRWN